MQKIKILFVVAGFYRAGAERFAYEIDKALDKEKFELSILSLEGKREISKLWNVRYYEELHKELGTRIKYADDFIDKRFHEKDRLRNKIKRQLRLFPRHINYWKVDALSAYMNQFEVIHWMGEYIFINDIFDEIKQKSLIHMMTARFQKRNLYDNFDYSFNYNFCTPFKKEELEYELEQFNNYHSVFIPLVMEVDREKCKWKFNNDIKIKKIGIFTRLNPFKPLDPFFYSFQLLLDKYPNVELHIFGAGDPNEYGMTDMLERLAIQDKVFFRGHQEDIVLTAINENLALSWFQGYNNHAPSGYAGIDICTSGTPLLCWDFCPNPNSFENEIYPHYKNLNKFVDKTISLLNDEVEATLLSEKQYNDVVKNRNIKDHIKVVENEYTRIKTIYSYK